MDQPGYQSPESSGESPATKQPGVMIRGADGALYIVTEKDLAPFRVPEEKARQISDILAAAPAEIVSSNLSPDVMETLHKLAKCVHAHIQIKLPKP